MKIQTTQNDTQSSQQHNDNLTILSIVASILPALAVHEHLDTFHLKNSGRIDAASKVQMYLRQVELDDIFKNRNQTK